MTAVTIHEAMAQLPQADLIPEERANYWLERTRVIDPERVDWHIKRAAGFGGSEIGGLVMGLRGDPTFFSTPTSTVRSKLLMAPPEPPTIHTKRGSELEPFVKATFERMLQKTGANWRCRDDLREQVSAAEHPVYGWVRCNVDEFYEINGDIYIVDFKAPTADTLAKYRSEGGYDEYVYQIHHYELGARGQGIAVKAGCIAMYDYNANEIACFDVDFDEGKTGEIIEAGEYYWRECVMKGAVPAPVLPEYVVPDGDVPLEIQASAQEYIEAKILEGAIKWRVEDSRAVVEEWVRSQGLVGDKVLLMANLMQIRAKEVLDIEAAVSRLRDAGLSEYEIDGFRHPPKFEPKKLQKNFLALSEAVKGLVATFEAGELHGKVFFEAIAGFQELISADIYQQKGAFDPKKIIDGMVSCNLTPENFKTEVLSSSLPRGRNLELKARRSEVSDEVDRILSEKTQAGAPEPKADEKFAEFRF